MILRLGLVVTFFWIGVFILKEPEAWGSFIKPWAAKLLPFPLKEIMIGNGILDIIIGALFLINPLVWLAAAFGSIHLATVLVASGVNEITVRDIGLLAASLALMVETWPEKYKFWRK